MDFAAAVKYLDKVVSRVATESESSRAKDFSRLSSRDIKKLHYYLTIPAKYYDYDEIKNEQVPRMLFQYNVILPGSSYILEVPSVTGILKCGVLCVKYRVGSVVYRYRLARSSNLPNPLKYTYFPAYNREILQPYAVIEFWFTGTSAMFKYDAGVVSPISFKLSKLVNPTTPDQTAVIADAAAALDISAIGFDMDASLPISQPTIVYTSN